jgi:hypothetical protein
MPKPTRRDFLVASGAGAAAAGALVVLPAGADATPLRAPRDAKPMVVHIPDADGAELHLHVGAETKVVRDRELVIRIQRAAAKEG